MLKTKGQQFVKGVHTATAMTTSSCLLCCQSSLAVRQVTSTCLIRVHCTGERHVHVTLYSNFSGLPILVYYLTVRHNAAMYEEYRLDKCATVAQINLNQQEDDVEIIM